MSVSDDEDRPYVLAVCTSRVIFGNERAFRDALDAIGPSVEECCIFVRNEDWNSNITDFFSKSCKSIIKIPVVEYPLRGYIKKIIIESPFRYLKSNYIFLAKYYNLKHKSKRIIIIISDTSIFLTLNISLLLLKSDIIYRCGSRPHVHNFLQKILSYFMRAFVSYYVVDSNFMKDHLINMGIKSSNISVIRPIPPKRN